MEEKAKSDEKKKQKTVELEVDDASEVKPEMPKPAGQTSIKTSFQTLYSQLYSMATGQQAEMEYV